MTCRRLGLAGAAQWVEVYWEAISFSTNSLNLSYLTKKIHSFIAHCSPSHSVLNHSSLTHKLYIKDCHTNCHTRVQRKCREGLDMIATKT